MSDKQLSKDEIKKARDKRNAVGNYLVSKRNDLLINELAQKADEVSNKYQGAVKGVYTAEGENAAYADHMELLNTECASIIEKHIKKNNADQNNYVIKFTKQKVTEGLHSMDTTERDVMKFKYSAKAKRDLKEMSVEYGETGNIESSEEFDIFCHTLRSHGLDGEADNIQKIAADSYKLGREYVLTPQWDEHEEFKDQLERTVNNVKAGKFEYDLSTDSVKTKKMDELFPRRFDNDG